MQTSSWKFPNMIDVTKNRINVAYDAESVVNRIRLLMLTEPTEMYNELNFGVGMKRYLWQYNTDNVRALLYDKIKAQLKLWEPCVDAEKTTFTDGLLFTGDNSNDLSVTEINKLKFTMAVHTIFGDTLDIDIQDLQKIIDRASDWYALQLG